jgi:enediyne biosynthesis protein E4
VKILIFIYRSMMNFYQKSRNELLMFFLYLLALFLNFSASAQVKLFTPIKSAQSGLVFNNIVEDTKLLNVISYEYYYNGGATCVGDVNNDGLVDIFFSANIYECKLFLNEGNLKFRDVTKSAKVTGEMGYHTGAMMVDINSDGWLDIYVCRSVFKDEALRKNVLYINNHDGTFTDKATEYGLADIGYATQAYFNDLDGDGDLDAFVLNHP